MFQVVIAYDALGNQCQSVFRLLGFVVVVRASVIAFIDRNEPHRHMSDRMVAVVTEKVVGGVFPVGIHDPFVHSADNFGSTSPAVEHNAELPLLATEVFQSRGSLRIKGGEDKSLQNVQLCYRDQPHWSVSKSPE